MLWVYDFENANSCKTRKTSARPKAQHDSHRRPAIATTSRRYVINHFPPVGPCSPASIHLEFVEICLVQRSQSVKTTNVTHTDTHTDYLNDGTLYAPRYEEVFLPKGEKTASLKSSFLVKRKIVRDIVENERRISISVSLPNSPLLLLLYYNTYYHHYFCCKMRRARA